MMDIVPEYEKDGAGCKKNTCRVVVMTKMLKWAIQILSEMIS